MSPRRPVIASLLIFFTLNSRILYDFTSTVLPTTPPNHLLLPVSLSSNIIIKNLQFITCRFCSCISLIHKGGQFCCRDSKAMSAGDARGNDDTAYAIDNLQTEGINGLTSQVPAGFSTPNYIFLSRKVSFMSLIYISCDTYDLLILDASSLHISCIIHVCVGWCRVRRNVHSHICSRSRANSKPKVRRSRNPDRERSMLGAGCDDSRPVDGPHLWRPSQPLRHHSICSTPPLSLAASTRLHRRPGVSFPLRIICPQSPVPAFHLSCRHCSFRRHWPRFCPRVPHYL